MKKRKAPEQREALPASVRIDFANLPPCAPPPPARPDTAQWLLATRALSGCFFQWAKLSVPAALAQPCVRVSARPTAAHHRPPLPTTPPIPPTAACRRDSRRRLDEAIRGWADWHAEKYLPGYVPPEVVSGALAYQPDTMHLGAGLAGGGAPGGGCGAAGGPGSGSSNGGGIGYAWEDRPAAPAKSGPGTLWFNLAYEKVRDDGPG